MDNKQNGLLISFIIPSYNAEKTICDCVNRIIENDVDGKSEVIIIDDGSTDSSIRLSEDMVRKDNRIKLVRQNHQGVVTARKNGLIAAQGKYIWFVDADDLIAEGAIRRLTELSEKNNFPDIISFQHYLESNNIRREEKQLCDYKMYSHIELKEIIYPNMFQDYRQKLFRKPIIDGFLWNKMIKRDIVLKSYNIPDNISLFEDVVITSECLLNSRSLLAIDDYLYVYRKNDNASASLRKRNDYFENTFLIDKYFAENSNVDNTIAIGRNAFIAERLIVSIVREININNSSKAAKTAIAGELKKYPVDKGISYKGLPLPIAIFVFLVKHKLYWLLISISTKWIKRRDN